MTHPLHDYLCQQLDERLRKNAILVFYDPRREFEPFFDKELKNEGSGNGRLPRVRVKGRLTSVARFRGSYFKLRDEVEPIVQVDSPKPLILYLPGVERDRKGSILMELEKGGGSYEPQLKRLAANVLRRHFTQGRVDKMLAPSKVSYTDIAAFLRQDGDGLATSVLHTFFGGAKSEDLIARWIAEEETDAGIAGKEVKEELFNLIESRLGLAVPTEDALATARAKVVRHVLVNEFRLDLDCEPPSSTAMVPSPPTREHRNRAREVAETLRSNHGASYVTLADRVEGELGLVVADIDARFLGKIDTFRFEERALLAHAAKLISARKYVDALKVVNERSRSFWVDRNVNRQGQWEACRLMGELGEAVKEVRPLLGKSDGGPGRWVQAYASEQGWCRVDSLQRNLETWVAKMDQEPETEQPLALVRREHEELLKKMAEGFTEVFVDAGWSVPGVLHQTQIYADVVKAMGGRTAYFLVDAMRYEMGTELAQQLNGAEDLTVRPAIAALPTITPVGMAALLPGASAGFSVVESKNNLAADVEGSVMVNSSERMKFLKAKVPGAIEMLLGKLLSEPASRLKKSIDRASLVLVRSQEIDALGENVDELTARAAMEGVIGNVARAIRKLATAGVEKFVVTADHGHQFSMRKEEDMKADSPGGNALDVHRRCWTGHGGATPPGCVRVSGADLGYGTNLEFVFPKGLGVFKTGGGLTFHHGGTSLQELVIPVVSLRIPSRDQQVVAGSVTELRDVPDKITNRTFVVGVRVSGDLFADERRALRVVLVSESQQVGHAGMAIGGELDRSSHVLHMNPNSEANVGMVLTRDDCAALRIVVQDPKTDAVLDRPSEIPVNLGI